MTARNVKNEKHLFSLHWLLLAGGCFLALGLFIFHVIIDYRDIDQQERQRLLTQARVIEKNINLHIEKADAVIRALRDDLFLWRLRGNIPIEAGLRVRGLAESSPGIRTVLVLDKQGVAILSNRPELLGTDFHNRAYFQTASKIADPTVLHISSPFETVLGVRGVNLTRMLLGPDGDFAGVITATLDPDYFSTLLDSVRFAPDMWAAIYHAEGSEYLRLSDSAGGAGFDVSRSESFFAHHKSNHQAESIFSDNDDANGRRWMVAFVNQSMSAELVIDQPLVVAAGRNWSALFRRWCNATSLESLLVVTFIAALVFLLYRYHVRLHKEWTARREADEALLASEARFRELAFASADWIWEVDAKGRYTYIAGGVNRLGYESDELVGRMAGAFMPADEACRMRQIRKQLLAEKKNFSDLRSLSIAKDGTIHTISTSGRPILNAAGEVIGFRGVDRDITELQRAEEQLRILQRAVDQSPLSIVITDIKGDIIYVNPGFCRITGYLPSEAIGQNPRILKSGDMSSEGYVQLWATITSGGEWRGEFLNKKKSGELYWELAAISPIRSAQGKITHFLAIKEDITERKRTERALAEAKREVEEASRAKSHFLAQMSHELRTPINAVIGFADMLLGGYFGSLGDKQTEYVEDIRKAGKHLLSLITPILDLSKIEAGKLELLEGDVSVRLMVDECLALIRGQVGSKNIAISAELAPELPYLRADEKAVRQILLNILGNAVKFTPDGGSISVSAGLSPAGGLDIIVTDTGVGIASADMERLFQPFRQGDPYIARDKEGTGLGLAITKALVEAHKGSIHIESTPGKGTTVLITFPQERLLFDGL